MPEIGTILLAPEVIASVIGALLGGFITWLAVWRRTRQGNRIIVRRVSHSPQIQISGAVSRDSGIDISKLQLKRDFKGGRREDRI